MFAQEIGELELFHLAGDQIDHLVGEIAAVRYIETVAAELEEIDGGGEGGALVALENGWLRAMPSSRLTARAAKSSSP